MPDSYCLNSLYAKMSERTCNKEIWTLIPNLKAKCKMNPKYYCFSIVGSSIG